MTPEEVLSKLEDLLHEEHAALQAMKSARVGELASEKELWFTRLVDSGAFTRAELKPRLRDLHVRMKKNALLITYARDLTLETLTAIGAIQKPGYARVPNANIAFTLPGRSLSTTG